MSDHITPFTLARIERMRRGTHEITEIQCSIQMLMFSETNQSIRPFEFAEKQ